MSSALPVVSDLEIRPRLDGVRLLAIAFAAYIAAFTLAYGPSASQGGAPLPGPYTSAALISGLCITVIGLVLSIRTMCILGWGILAITSGTIFELHSFALGQLADIAFLTLGLGIPLLLLLETMMTIEGAGARARVVFRAKALVKASALLLAILVGLILLFSSWGLLERYSSSPEAATFHSVIMAGLSAMILGRVLLARPAQEGGEG
jgi:hypothetical protein